jgi:hypothetical protein
MTAMTTAERRKAVAARGAVVERLCGELDRIKSRLRNSAVDEADDLAHEIIEVAEMAAEFGEHCDAFAARLSGDSAPVDEMVAAAE